MLVSDTVLSIRVRRALQDSAELRCRDLEVHVMDAVVTLAGTVPEEWMKVEAGRLAEAVYGVDEVDNRIRTPGG